MCRVCEVCMCDESMAGCRRCVRCGQGGSVGGDGHEGQCVGHGVYGECGETQGCVRVGCERWAVCVRVGCSMAWWDGGVWSRCGYGVCVSVRV